MPHGLGWGGAGTLADMPGNTRPLRDTNIEPYLLPKGTGEIKIDAKVLANGDGNPKTGAARLKPPLHLVPPVLAIATSYAFADGERKYSAFNWRETGVTASTYIAAAMRHLDRFRDGSNHAKDSGVHELAHASACIAILLDAMSLGVLKDDRPAPGASDALCETREAGDLKLLAATITVDEGPTFKNLKFTTTPAPPTLNRYEPLWIKYNQNSPPVKVGHRVRWLSERDNILTGTVYDITQYDNTAYVKEDTLDAQWRVRFADIKFVQRFT